MEKIACITGGTGGIGFATAKEFGKLGYSLIINGIDDKQAEVAMKELADLDIKAEYYHFNVTIEEEVVANFKKISEKYDHLDVLVNNAGGLGGRSRFEGMTTEFYRSVMALNLDSAFFVTRECIPMLKKSKEASVVNFASNAAWNAGGPGAGIYGTSKAAIVTLTRALAKDLAEFGIRVNAVSPGTIDTPFHDGIRKTNPALFESWKNNILLKRFGQPEEVASVISFLCSEKASFITGEIIQVNGGQDFL
jgi:NAD(P)-dependent dehydrogenase (short-subunit alcohol dehydrogenase family)